MKRDLVHELLIAAAGIVLGFFWLPTAKWAGVAILVAAGFMIGLAVTSYQWKRMFRDFK